MALLRALVICRATTASSAQEGQGVNVEPESECPAGYAAATPGDRACFRAFCTPTTAAGARDVCEADGAHLAKIDNEIQNVFVRILACGADWVWIGLTSEGRDDMCWYWHGYTDATGFANFDQGQPANDGHDEDCVAMGMESQPEAMGWHDCGCETGCTRPGQLALHVFVCRKDVGGSSSSAAASSCANDCHTVEEQGFCDSGMTHGDSSSHCTCFGGWHGEDCGCPADSECGSVQQTFVELPRGATMSGNCIVYGASMEPHLLDSVDGASMEPHLLDSVGVSGGTALAPSRWSGWSAVACWAWLTAT